MQSYSNESENSGVESNGSRAGLNRGQVSDMLQLVVDPGNIQAMLLPVTSHIESSLS
jgi:hypothetical protein